MTAIAQKITTIHAGSPAEMALRIKKEAPTLAELNSDQLEQIARIVLTQRLASDLNTAVNLAGIDWQEQRAIFLNDTKSSHTRRAYAAALKRLEAWANREGINPLSLNASNADAFIRALKAENRAPASIRRDIAAISTFYSFLERYYAAIKNPFRGTKIRPPKENKKEILIPTLDEYKIIIEALPPVEKAIVTCLALRGLRIGALPTLKKKGKKYTGKSKGKTLEENNAEGITLPEEILEAIKAADLNVDKPFYWTNANALQRRINYWVGKLYKTGKIRGCYSCHDFRHFFAVTSYQKDKDIYRLSKLLNHAGIQTTQSYLKSLGIEV